MMMLLMDCRKLVFLRTRSNERRDRVRAERCIGKLRASEQGTDVFCNVFD